MVVIPGGDSTRKPTGGPRLEKKIITPKNTRDLKVKYRQFKFYPLKILLAPLSVCGESPPRVVLVLVEEPGSVYGFGF